MKNYEFYRSLHNRGMTLEVLAEVLKTKPGHLSMVFNGTRGRNTRKHLVEHLTPKELELLGWDAQGNLLPKAPKADGTNSQT